MTNLELWTIVTALAAVATAIATGWSAVATHRTWKLAAQSRNKADAERHLKFGKPFRPKLAYSAHAAAVVAIPVVNLSKDICCISSVLVKDTHKNEIETTWSNEINDCGNPQNCDGLVRVADKTTLYVRNNLGANMDEGTLHIKHDFAETEVVIEFDVNAPFVEKFLAAHQSQGKAS